MDTSHWPDVEKDRQAMPAPSAATHAANHAVTYAATTDDEAGAPDETQDALSSERAGRRGAPRRRMDQLSRAVESDVIPRLVSARRSAARPRQSGPRANVCSDTHVIELARLVLLADEEQAPRFVTSLNANGLPMEAVYTDLFGGTARHLGDLWCEDLITFTHVTTGVWRLQQMLHQFRGTFLAETPRRDTGLRVLLAPMIGNQHSFGMTIAGEFFRRDGWTVETTMITSNSELADLVRTEWFDAMAFSLGDTLRLDELRITIAAGRAASRNLRIGIMVGGSAFLADPANVQRVGADVAALDGRDAARMMEETLNIVARS